MLEPSNTDDRRPDVETWEQEKQRLLAPPVITTAWVAYLDILGYREMIKDAVASDQLDAHIMRLRTAVHFLGKSVAIAREHDMVESIRVFSDSIFIVARKNNTIQDLTGVHDMIYLLCDLVGSLAEQGLFVRGAAVLGKHHDEADLVVSPALIRAYDMERRESCYPRVLVDEDVRHCYLTCADLIQEGHIEGPGIDRQRDRLWRDHDGRCFVNYLARFHDLEACCTPPRGGPFLLAHKKRVEASMAKYTADPHVAAKYQWLATYHNRFCRHVGDAKLGSIDDFIIHGCDEQGPLPLPSEVRQK
ncbi:MAG TPA: hypothetical protein VGM19_14835 [Armatimonadota bacterium]|jgi:hypothetical protein